MHALHESVSEIQIPCLNLGQMESTQFRRQCPLTEEKSAHVIEMNFICTEVSEADRETVAGGRVSYQLRQCQNSISDAARPGSFTTSELAARRN